MCIEYITFLENYLLPALRSSKRMLTQIGSQTIKNILKEKQIKVIQQIHKKIVSHLSKSIP